MREYWQSLKTDAVVRWTGAVLAAFVLLYLLLHIFLGPQALARRGLAVVFLGLTVTALARGLRELPRPERRFWRVLTIGFSLWLVVALLYLAFPAPEKPPAVQIGAQILLALFYVALILAVEGQPHRRENWQLAHLERALLWPGVALLALGFFAYFVVIPHLAGDDDGVWTSDMFLYITFDLYLTGRLLHDMALSRTPRWRLMFGLLGAGTAGLFANDLLEYLSYSEIFVWQWGTALDLLLAGPLVLIILAARLRHLTVEGPAWDRTRGSLRFELPHEPSGISVVWALAFPLVHYSGYAMQVFTPISEAPRQWVVFGGALLLGGLALFQHHLFQRRMQALWLERVELEATMQGGEKDLRLMIERRHARHTLSAAEERFNKAVRSLPDGVAIVTRKQGRFVKVNDGFARDTGYSRREILGRTIAELGLWWQPAERADVLRRLRRRGRLKDRKTEFRTRDGERRLVRLTAEEIDFEGRPCYLIISRDVTEIERAGHARPPARLLERTHDAVTLLDLEGRVALWSPQAESLYGWAARDVVGRDARETLLAAEPSQVKDVLRRVAESGTWTGSQEVLDPDGRKQTVDSHWTLVRDTRGEPVSQLILSAARDR